MYGDEYPDTSPRTCREEQAEKRFLETSFQKEVSSFL